MGRRWLNGLFYLLIGATVLFSAIGPIKRQTVVTCSFEMKGGSSPLRFASPPATLGKIRIEGSLSGDNKDRLFHYDGRATWIMRGREAEGAVTGAIFLASDGAVDGLSLDIAHPAFGSNELSLATLNADGFLDDNRSTAFLFFDKTEKLLHPATFNCRSDRNYQHIYQRLASFNLLALLAFFVLVWGVLFLAKRKAESIHYGER